MTPFQLADAYSTFRTTPFRFPVFVRVCIIICFPSSDPDMYAFLGTLSELDLQVSPLLNNNPASSFFAHLRLALGTSAFRFPDSTNGVTLRSLQVSR